MFRNNRIRWPIAIVAVLAFVLLNGCMKREAKTVASEESGVTLRIIQSLTNEPRTEALRDLLDRFEELHPEIKVELLSPGNSVADERIEYALRDRVGIDVVEVRDQTLVPLVEQKLLLNLTAYADKWKDYAGLSEDAKHFASEWDGAVYYIPNGLYRNQLYYRKDRFDEKALQVPETWEELYYTGKRLTNPAKGEYGLAFRGEEGPDRLLTQLIQDYNGDHVDTLDGMYKLDRSTIFNGIGARDGALLYKKLYEELSPPQSVEWSYTEQADAFANGSVSMMIADAGAIALLNGKLESDNWATAPLPVGPQGISHYAVRGAGWGITSYSSHIKEAWSLIEFLSSPAANEEFGERIGVIPIYPRDASFLQSGPYASFWMMDQNEEQYVRTQPPSHYYDYSIFYKQGKDQARRYLDGDITVEELLKDLDDFWRKERTNGKAQAYSP
ncbi:ABC transporter substrate-binding protein [Paenibacillus gorillae]|uniref:ABC transporter substrate-binding protein n=1 Tax=Paenibacillus gorillae TaxID=1243662 RepID=UPI0004AE21B4|nr:sugar ABC transporter substrate-binding protein [Paenibacillus gorillae]